MARYIGHVTSPRPIEDVFDYLADFSNVRDWDPSAVESRGPERRRSPKGRATPSPPASWGERCRSPMR